MGVDGGSGGGSMSQVFLDDAQIDASFKQMGSPGMSQSMNGSWFGDATFVEGGLKGMLDPIWSPGVLARLKDRWKKPDWIAMSNPILAQQIQDGFGQGHITVFPPFSMADVQQEAIAVDVGDLQVQSFLQTQPTGIDGAQADPIMHPADTSQNTAYFAYTEHDRQFLLPGRAHKIEGLPFPTQGVLEEKLDPAQVDGAGTACSMFFVLEIQKVLPQFFFVDLVRGFVIVPGQLANSQ